MHRRLTALILLTAAVASAQTHRVRDASAVTRAVSVFEWTGDDIAKPISSRIVPVSLFIHGHFEGAGIYMSQPIPLAIMPDTRYQLQTAGVVTGNVDLSFARNLKVPGSAVSSNYDDGWFGYGKFQPLPKPKFESAAVAKTSEKNDGRPRFGKRSSSGSSKDGDKVSEKEQASVRDPDSPDPERPTFQKEDITTGDPRKDRRKEDKKNDVSGVESVPGGPGSTPSNDDDRPVFRKRTASEAPATDTVGVTEKRDGMLNDPTRPTLHRGRPSGSTTGEDLGALRGLPEDIHQSVAVSDAVDRPEHNFAHKWADDAERGKVKAQLEEMARAVIANPKLAQETANASANPALGGYAVTTPLAARQASAALATANGTARRKGVAAKKTSIAHPVEAAVPLEDERFSAYDLAYNSVPTYVLTAHTSGAGDQLKYITVVASPDTFGTMQPIMRSITDASHLNIVPRLRLVDVVDPDASNRASLLFELRRENSRFFALYRIYGAKASQIYMSGITQ